MKKKKKKMTTTKDISNGLKIIIFIIPGIWAIGTVLVSKSYLVGQTTEQVQQTIQKVDKIDVMLNESARVREDTAVKIGKLETKMENIEKKVDALDNKLDKILEKITP